jgi:hypothetical protein
LENPVTMRQAETLVAAAAFAWRPDLA